MNIELNPVWGSGPIGAKLMILGDCPDEKDIAAGKHFSGAKGKELSYIAQDIGLNVNNCWLSTVSKHYVQPNGRGEKKIPFEVRAKLSNVDMDEQLKWLQEEIKEVKPNCILALGTASLWALSGKTNLASHRGSIMHGMGCKFVPSYHPRDLSFHASGSEFKGYWNRQIMAFDYKRASEQSAFPERRLPVRTLEICRTSYQLHEFLQRHKGKYTKVYVDIEAHGSCLPACIGFAFTPFNGITVPLWNCDGISTIPDADMTQCWIMINEILTTFEVIGQNFNYDRDKLLRIGFTIPKYVGDTMFKAFAINPELPKGLAFNTSIYTEEPYYKDEGMYNGPIADLFTGCARDACVTCEIDLAMDKDIDEIGQRKFYQNFLMKQPDLYWEIEKRGFRVDESKREFLLQKYISWKEEVRYRLFQLIGSDVNVNSPKQVSILLYETLGLPNKYATDEESITELLNSIEVAKNKEVTEILESILKLRRINKSISTYILALPDYDGRMRTTCFSCLETGRSKNGQQEPPIRPTIEIIDENGKKKNKNLGIAFQTMTKHGDIGADVREMYIVDEPVLREELPLEMCEEVFVQADSEQAEARVVWLLADDEDALEKVDTLDYHAHTATWFFGQNEELFNYDKKKLGYEHPIRFVGKTLRHAGHLGATKRRASISVNTDARKFHIDIHITEKQADDALKIFHSRQPKIQKVFQAGVVECLKKDRILIAPVPYGIDSPVGGRRTFYERWGEELFRAAYSYIPQRTVTDNTKAAGMRIKERCPGIKIVVEAHDALLFCMPRWRLKKWVPIIKQEFERPISFKNCSMPRRDLIIPCGIEFGTDYKNLSGISKFKLFELPDFKFEKPKKPKKLAKFTSITDQFTVQD